MANYSVSFDLSGIAGIADILQDTYRNSISNLVGSVADGMKSDWQKAVQNSGGKGGLSDYERHAYADSIGVEFKEGDLQALVYASFEHASQIEEGRPARDLKAALNTSTKVRMSKNGKKYLIIPFRHNVKTFTGIVAKAASAMGTSRITGKTLQDNGMGKQILRNTYQWDKSDVSVKHGRGKKTQHLSFTGAFPAGVVPKLKPSHVSDRLAGMRRFDGSTSGAKSSVYLTFRVMVEGSSGWIVPAKPGLFIAKGVEQRGQATLNAQMQAIASAASLA